MDSTPITTPSLRRRVRTRGFSLVELLVATAMSGIVLAGVMAAVLMIARSGYLLNNYIDMEKEARAALETIAVDARVTQEVSWQRADDASPLTGIILTSPDGISVRYDYDSASGTLRRTEGGKVRVLITGIRSLTFSAYQYANDPGVQPINSATNTLTSLNGLTKMLQISLSSGRSRSSLVDATNNVVSARYVLRNKVQTN